MNLRRHILGLTSALGLLSTGYWCYSDSASQVFRVNAPGRVSIVAPTLDPEVTYSGLGNTDLSFPRQSWTVKSNSQAGASVILETATCFQHSITPTAKRDGRLALRVQSTTGPALWAVTRATDTTNYSLGDENARVQVISDNVGEAQLGLTVTFITGIGADLEEAGDYALTVVGTITAN